MKRDLLLVAVLVAVGLAQNLACVDATPFHPDETRWLNRGRYLREVLAPRGRTWNDHFLTRGQPPGGSYLMGLGLLAQGRPLEPNGVWRFDRDDLWNVRHGNLPAQADLAAGRRTNAVVAALAGGVVYLLGRRVTNRLGGAVGALALALHPLLIRLGSQALSDAFLALVLALAALAACPLADRPTWPRALLLGALLGLGGQRRAHERPALGEPGAVRVSGREGVPRGPPGWGRGTAAPAPVYAAGVGAVLFAARAHPGPAGDDRRGRGGLPWGHAVGEGAGGPGGSPPGPPAGWPPRQQSGGPRVPPPPGFP